MRTRNAAFILTLVAGLLISACQLMVVTPTQEPTSGCRPMVVTPTQEPTPTEEIVKPTPDGTVVEGKIGELKSDQSLITDAPIAAEDLKRLAEAENAFMLNLYEQVAEGDENVIFSPYSLYQALLMAYVGAAGQTAQQMAAVLELPLEGEFNHLAMNGLDNWLTKSGAEANDKPKFVFNSANAVWGQYDYAFKQTYLDQLAMYYGAGLRAVDFGNSEEARVMINDWVADKTQNKIKDLIPQGVLDEATRMVLTNAVYFKAAWMKQFEDLNTRPDSFYLLDGSSKQIDMMAIEENFSYYLGSDYTVIELPYDGGMSSMVVVMPKEGTLKDFETRLDTEMLTTLTETLEHGKVQLSFPKFKFESKLDLGQVLSALGMSDAFDANLADFSGMTSAKDLMISNVLQKALVEVDEKGTEAAAATAVIIGITSAPVEADPQVIKIDHPFLFFIRDLETNATLFMGRVIAP